MMTASRWMTILACATLLVGTSASAATVLSSFRAVNSPNSQGWGATSGSLVTGTLVNDQGTSAWKLTDSTSASGTNYLNYSTAISDANYALMLAQGWNYTVSLRLPEPDELDAGAWAVDRNVFAAVVIRNGSTSRLHYGLNFGRDLAGNALVGINGSNTTKTVGIGYHEYSIRYDASQQTTAVYVDDVFWSLINPSTLSAGTQHQALWGDNLAQTQARAERSSYFREVTLSLVPEPSQAILALLGLGTIALRRQRLV